ncbi:hypothetical protein [Micromonospora sp. NPDC023956]|uniref:phage tail protein n=1 Tax=Micromonospora sp. NPDC023956 TaxID=3155722 RepID=UPI0033E6DD9A
MSNVGYASLQIMPSAKNFRRHLQKETEAPLLAWAKEAGEAIGDAIGKAVGPPVVDGLRQAITEGVDRAAEDGARTLGEKLTEPIGDRVRESVGDGIREGADDGAEHTERAVGRGLREALRDGFRRGFSDFFSTAQGQGARMRKSLALGVAGGLIKGAKEGFEALMEGLKDFGQQANKVLGSIAQTGLSAVSGLITTGATTVATGGLNLLVGALLAVAAAVPMVIAGFLALAPVVALVGGLVGSLFTILVGGVASVGMFALAFRGLGDAFREITEEGKLSRETLKKLHPEAAKFVQAFGKLRKPFRELSKYVQGAFFDKLDKSLKSLATKWLPVLEPMLGNLAGSFNTLAKRIMNALGKPDFIENIRYAVAGFGTFIDEIGKGLEPFIGAIGKIARAAVPFLEAMGRGIGGLLEKFSAWIAKAEQSGALTTFFEDAVQVLRDIWAIGGLVVGIIGELIDTFFPASKRAGDSFFGGVRNILADIKAWLADPENKAKIQEFMVKLGDFVKKAVEEWIPAMLRMVQRVGEWIKKIEEWGAKWDAFRAKVSAIWTAVKTVVTAAVASVLQKLASIKGGIDRVIGFFGELRSGAARQFSALLALVSSLPGQIVRALGNVGGLLVSAGSDLVGGFIRGMASRFGDVLAEGRRLAAGAINSVKGALGINSPSRVFMEIGGWTAEGMALGVERGQDRVTKAVNAMVRIPDSATSRPATSYSASASAPGKTEYHLHESRATIAQLQALQVQQAIIARVGRAV